MKIRSRAVEKYAELPVPKWKRAPLPEGLFEKPLGHPKVKIECDHSRVYFGSIDPEATEGQASLYTGYRGLRGSHNKSLGEKFEAYVSAFSPSPFLIVSRARLPEIPRIKLSYTLEEPGCNQLLEHLIVAEEGAGLEVILDLTSKSEDPLGVFVRTQVVAKSGARVKIVKVQRLGEKSQAFDMGLSVVEDGGTVEIIDLQLGADYKAVAHESELRGRNSRSELKSAYYGEKEQQLDLSYTMTHEGRQSESVILTKGVLTDASRKVFRGNLFFEKGSSGSVGREQEFVTLMSPHAKSDAFPALMCAEDDVVGEHAASVGQIEGDKLFYLMSRGLSEKAARRLLVKASFEEIVREIGDLELENLVIAEVDRRMGA